MIFLAFRKYLLVNRFLLCGLTDSVVPNSVSVRRRLFLIGVVAYCLPQAKLAPIRARTELAGYRKLKEVSGYRFRNATLDHIELLHF
jgi:hypothetical protein